MKSATLAVRKLIQEGTEVRATPQLRVEFEHNRYSKIKSLDDKGTLVAVTPANDPLNNEWSSVFDANAITMPNRPETGIAKARLTETIKLLQGYVDKAPAARFYAASDEDPYTYWASTSRTSATAVATADYNFPTPIKLTMMYEEKLISNKVVVGFETSYARPRSYDIQITEVANPTESQWRTIGSNIVPNTKSGQVALWLTNDSPQTWGTTPVYNLLGWVHGVRLIVRSMNEGGAHLDVIQLGARLERDISDIVINYSKSMEVSERSFIAPVGAASSNQAAVTLSNFDQAFNDDNEASIFYGLVDKKAKFTMDLRIDATPTGGQPNERIREFTMWADSWGNKDEDSVSVNLKDSSVFLQEVDMPKVFWENLTIGAICWQIMDTVGLTNYAYNQEVIDSGQIIPYFWANEGTAWEQISELSEATQTAVYFDEYDIMQIKTRKSIFGTHKTVDWNFDAVQNNAKLPDVIESSTDDNMVVNHVEINWKPAEFRENKGVPEMETVWEPSEESVVLRGTALLRDIPLNGMSIYISAVDASHWPFESHVNIRGEIMKYKGKEYLKYKKGGGTELKIVTSVEEKTAIDDDSDPAMIWSNNWTGRLVVTERGVSGSGKAEHKLKPNAYTASIVTRVNGTFLESRSNWHHQKNGFVQLSVPPNKPDDLIYVMRPNATVPTANTLIGARIRFPEKQIRADQFAIGGLQFASDFGDIGYYLEFMTTKMADSTKRMTNEINLWMGGAGSNPLTRAVTGAKAVGVAANIVYDKWYDLEVKHIHNFDGSANIMVYLDGMFMNAWNIPKVRRGWFEQGNFGVYARGSCVVDVDYLYSLFDAGSLTPDASSFFDLTNGGLSSGFIEREWRWAPYMQTGVAALREGGRRITHFGNRAFYYYDEFGPVVHEVREFDVEFNEDDVPVAHSFPYISNTQVFCTDYTANAFGAKFTLVNASRRDAVIKGEDSITFGIDNKIDQKMFIYGRKLFQEEENVIIKKDDQSIRAKGKVALDIDNKFVQTEKMANELGDWVVGLWSLGADEVSVQVFGNPLVQLGDLVTMNYPAKGLYPATHKYYIVSIKNDFNDGLDTNLILRRSK